MKFSDQRYYHFLVLQEKKNGGINRCIDWLESLRKNEELEEKDKVDSVFTLLPFFTEEPYSNSDEYFVDRENNEKLRCFDVWYYRFEIDTINGLIILFPFSKLGSYIFKNLDDSIEINQWLEFLSVDISKVIELSRNNKLRPDDLTKLYVSNIELAFKGDHLLKTMKLAGKDPLQSLTYKALVKARKEILEENKLSKKDKLSDDEKYTHKNKRIVLASELLVDEAADLRAKIHLDKFGNFKFYAHVRGKNFNIIPIFLRELKSINSLCTTSIFPIKRDTNSNNF